MCYHGYQLVVDITGTGFLLGSVDQLLHVDHPAKLDWFTGLAFKESKTFQWDAEHSWRPFDQTVLWQKGSDIFNICK